MVSLPIRRTSPPLTASSLPIERSIGQNSGDHCRTHVAIHALSLSFLTKHWCRATGLVVRGLFPGLNRCIAYRSRDALGVKRTIRAITQKRLALRAVAQGQCRARCELVDMPATETSPTYRRSTRSAHWKITLRQDPAWRGTSV